MLNAQPQIHFNKKTAQMGVIRWVYPILQILQILQIPFTNGCIPTWKTCTYNNQQTTEVLATNQR